MLFRSFDCSNLNVTLDAYKPTGTDIAVYYKALPVESTQSISTVNWVKMKLKGTVTNSNSVSDIREHSYYPEGAFNAYGDPVVSYPITPRFNAFIIKVVMISSSVAVTPKVYNFRTIALDA